MAREKAQSELLSEISLKLDFVMGFLAAKIAEDQQDELIIRMSERLPSDGIGRVFGLTENAVNVRLSRYRKKAGIGKRSGKRTGKKVTTNDQSSAQEGTSG